MSLSISLVAAALPGGRCLTDPHKCTLIVLQTPPEPSLLMPRQSDLKERIFQGLGSAPSHPLKKSWAFWKELEFVFESHFHHVLVL